ncbi:STM2901 family protein [Paraburkholderia bannensis]|uniref:STM2901 family protein n=1 Tax=Paraburkholderia bannensis TaxID=765414 RepID=UPI0012EB0DEA|nr:hypothetical protein [Paraburkholderia bannensis]
MNDYERLISNDPPEEETYNYQGELFDADKLLFCIFIEEICKHYGINDYDGIVAIVLIVAGRPFIPTRGKPGGATKGTSIASLVLRVVLDINFKKAIFPTITNSSFNKGAKFFRWTRNLGAFIGRWIPWIGATLTMYDVIKITFMTLHRYNQIVDEKDRVNDATTGSFG